MGKARKSNGKKAINGTRSIAPEVFEDKQASNLLNFKKASYQEVKNDNKTRNRSIDRARSAGKVIKAKASKKTRTYTEKELGIPKLNTALQPVGVKVKGKKGKKFVDDAKMQVILTEVQHQSRKDLASKLEKARQLEAIRDQKRKELEEREKQQQEKLEKKKSDVKSHKKNKKSTLTGPNEDSPMTSKKFTKASMIKKVQFA